MMLWFLNEVATSRICLVSDTRARLHFLVRAANDAPIRRTWWYDTIAIPTLCTEMHAHRKSVERADARAHASLAADAALGLPPPACQHVRHTGSSARPLQGHRRHSSGAAAVRFGVVSRQGRRLGRRLRGRCHDTRGGCRGARGCREAKLGAGVAGGAAIPENLLARTPGDKAKRT